mmetsp:Transcript_105688/g.315683  ORF Transcript_105688/g.315683 Transcript_105688/m.315683 type:complete len:514 (-) Transcript_105688:48-1589(-)
MASPFFPQQGQYVPLGRVSDFQDPLASPPADQGYRTNEPWRTTPDSARGAFSTSQARNLHIVKELAEDDDESIGQISEEGGTASEEEQDHCPCASRIVKSDKFRVSVAIAILGSAVAIAGETDHPELSIWATLDMLFLAFFTVEITLRILVYRYNFFCNQDWAWAWFDFGLVLFSLFDQVILDYVLDVGAELSDYLSLLRMVRILRILRVAKLFKDCDQLKMLATGLMESMQMVIWIMLLLFMFMLIFAIFLTDMVGNQAFKFKDPDTILEFWGGVMRTLITLFQFLTLDNWSEITREVTETMPLLRILFTIYISIAAFAMLSLLTGVIVDHMTEVSAKQEEEDDAEKIEELNAFMNGLKTYFTQNDASRIRIGAEDLSTLMQNQELLDKLNQYGVSIVGHEVEEFFELLDRDGDGWISLSEFEKGILRLREDKPKAQDVLRIRYAAERVARHLQGGEGEAATMRKLAEVNNFMTTVDDRLAELQRQLRGFMEFARANHGRSNSRMVSLFTLH